MKIEQRPSGGAQIGRSGGEPARSIVARRQRERIGDPRIVRRQSQPEKSTKRCGHADRTRRVGPDREWRDARGYHCRRAATRPSGSATGKARMFAVAVVRIFAGQPVSKLVEMRFAGEHSASRA